MIASLEVGAKRMNGSADEFGRGSHGGNEFFRGWIAASQVMCASAHPHAHSHGTHAAAARTTTSAIATAAPGSGGIPRPCIATRPATRAGRTCGSQRTLIGNADVVGNGFQIQRAANEATQ